MAEEYEYRHKEELYDNKRQLLLHYNFVHKHVLVFVIMAACLSPSPSSLNMLRTHGPSTHCSLHMHTIQDMHGSLDLDKFSGDKLVL